MQQEPSGLKLLEIFIYAGFAGLAGLLGHTLRTLESGGRLTLLRTAAEVAGAGFTGVLTLLACTALGVDTLWTGVTVGTMSWLGSNASIRVLEKFVYKQLGINQVTPTMSPPSTPDDTEGR